MMMMMMMIMIIIIIIIIINKQHAFSEEVLFQKHFTYTK